MEYVQWIKLCIDYLNDEKIQLIETMPEGDALAQIWVKLLCLAGKTNDQGLIYLTPEIPYTDDMLAIKFRKPAGIIRLALEAFEKLKMIQINDDQTIFILNWHKHQNLEGLDRIREQSRIRSRKYRKYRKIPIGNDASRDASRDRHDDRHDEITQRHDTDIELDKDIRIYASNIKNETKNGNAKQEYAPGVKLTETEYRKLCEDYNENETKRMITELSNALGNTIPENRYKSHYKTIRNWIERARAKERKPDQRRIEPSEKVCPECKSRYYGSACLNCGWGEQELREGKGK